MEVGCRRLVPLGMVCVERARVASFELSVFSNRVLLHYEWWDLALPGLEELKSQPDGDVAAESLKSHLVSEGETPGFVCRWCDCAPR